MEGVLKFPLPIPCNPGSHPLSFGSSPCALFRLQNNMQCCIISPISPASRHPENPASHPLYYYLLYISCSLFSVLSPPVPLHSKKLLGSSQMHYRSEGRWFKPQSLPSCCFLRQETLPHIVSQLFVS